MTLRQAKGNSSARRFTCSSLAITACVVVLGACENAYFYRPAVTSTTSATVDGQPASFYGVPPEAPQGNVRVATMGFAEIEAQGGGEHIRALHVRMVVANNSLKPWLVDTREIRAALPGYGESRAAFATGGQNSAPPNIEIPPRGERTIDLFYPLPSTMKDASKVPAFDLLWEVNTDSRRVVERTPFERIEIVPVYDYGYGYGYGYWGSPYWYDPYYVHGGAFVGVGLGSAYAQHPVVISPHYVAPPAQRVR
jgi:hypothetical protein